MSIYAMIKDIPKKPTVSAMAFNAELDEVKVNEALENLTKFIPVEILAPFTMAMSLSKDISIGTSTIYLIFVALTPIAFFLFATADKLTKKNEWPIISILLWRAFVATIAFSSWALTVPGNPYQEAVGGAIAACLAVIIVAPILLAIDTIVMRSIGEANV